MKRKYEPLPPGEALIPETEMERMKRTERTCFLSESERLALIERDPPKMPLGRTNRTGYMRIPERKSRA